MAVAIAVGRGNLYSDRVAVGFGANQDCRITVGALGGFHDEVRQHLAESAAVASNFERFGDCDLYSYSTAGGLWLDEVPRVPRQSGQR